MRMFCVGWSTIESEDKPNNKEHLKHDLFNLWDIGEVRLKIRSNVLPQTQADHINIIQSKLMNSHKLVVN